MLAVTTSPGLPSQSTTQTVIGNFFNPPLETQKKKLLYFFLKHTQIKQTKKKTYSHGCNTASIKNERFCQVTGHKQLQSLKMYRLRFL